MAHATLQHKELLTDTITAFWFKPDSVLDYTAGQFIEVTLPHSKHDDRGHKRWFTLASSPDESLLNITTRFSNESSSFKKALGNLRIGDVVEISQAMGDFVLPMQKSIPLLFVVAGIGVTPLRSILADVQHRHEQRNIAVMYTARDESDFIYTPIIDTVSTHAQYIQDPTQSATSLAPRVAQAYLDDPAVRIYISGPESFTEDLVTLLSKHSIPESNIITDYFHGYEA